MMPGTWPGWSGHTAKLGIGPYLVVTMTSFSIMRRFPPEGVGSQSAVQSLARTCGLVESGSFKGAGASAAARAGLAWRLVARLINLCRADRSGINPGRATSATHRSLRRRLPVARLPARARLRRASLRHRHRAAHAGGARAWLVRQQGRPGRAIGDGPPQARAPRLRLRAPDAARLHHGAGAQVGAAALPR